MVQEKMIDEQKQGEVLKAPGHLSKPGGKKLYIESYGCQMNFSDSEIVASVMFEHGYSATDQLADADVVFVNTCAIRDNAEQKVRNRLDHFKAVKRRRPQMVIGVLGCMAERLKTKLLEEEKIVDMVVGPDAYRDLPNLVATATSGQRAVNVFLSREETYADIAPVRLGTNGVTAFISIMRGCDNMCSFCVVPYTRGRERSRDPHSIVAEAHELVANGYREVTLLGQNVDSYKWKGPDGQLVNFAQLLTMVAEAHPLLRVRFSTSHPKDITEDVVLAMKRYDNICNYIHLPVQSGSSAVLERMNRTYDRDWYLDRIAMIRSIIPDISLSTDVICGFCGETDEDHEQTLGLMEQVRFDHAYMFMYSERPGTPAAKKWADDVDEPTKKRRLEEVIALQTRHAAENNRKDLGKQFKVLIEGPSKKDPKRLKGRNDHNKMLVFPGEGFMPGDYVMVEVQQTTSATLLGKIVRPA
ncbi:MAG: tRNA (N6-isopentenyl adenosine(37)-C2)-methylthiotransferase MiaB [Bacteroidetes bacterium]|nr:tRNA (N6-isopentenyl adenosine(37)-C2)-methylthiotransferase MiaB [Bacteroidota bacterium]